MVRRARRLVGVRLPPEVLDALRALKDRDGVGITHHIEKAVRAYLKRKHVAVAPIEQKGPKR